MMPGELTWRPEVQPCPGCGGDDPVALGRRGGGAHHARLGVEAAVVRCRSCHLVYCRPTLLPSGNPYDTVPSADYFHAHDGAEQRDLGGVLATRAAGMLGGPGRLLELGCGRGDLLLGARAAGWQVRGVEMTAGFAPNDATLEIELASIENAQSLRGRYDFVILAAILEHLYDPMACLRAVRAALAPGGLIYIDVPNECALWSRVANAYMRLRGRSWAVNLSPTFPPFHVVGFCPRSLRLCLEAAGFEVSELKTHRWQNELPVREGVISHVERWAADVVLGIGARIGMGAGISCWARRAPD